MQIPRISYGIFARIPKDKKRIFLSLRPQIIKNISAEYSQIYQTSPNIEDLFIKYMMKTICIHINNDVFNYDKDFKRV